MNHSTTRSEPSASSELASLALPVPSGPRHLPTAPGRTPATRRSSPGSPPRTRSSAGGASSRSRTSRPVRRAGLRRAGTRPLDGRQRVLPPLDPGPGRLARRDRRPWHARAGRRRLPRQGGRDLPRRQALRPLRDALRARRVRRAERRAAGPAAPGDPWRPDLSRRDRGRADLPRGARRRRPRRRSSRTSRRTNRRSPGGRSRATRSSTA